LIPDRDQLAFDRAVFPLAVLVELDAAGRVVLPAKDLQRAAVGREVTICGVRDHIEIVNRDEFERRLEETWKNFDEIQQQARAALMTRRQSGRMPDNS
jgi:DNA-binding transcriptional regulator/RsmH inhibitor MraZ